MLLARLSLEILELSRQLGHVVVEVLGRGGLFVEEVVLFLGHLDALLPVVGACSHLHEVKRIATLGAERCSSSSRCVGHLRSIVAYSTRYLRLRGAERVIEELLLLVLQWCLRLLLYTMSSVLLQGCGLLNTERITSEAAGKSIVLLLH